MCRMQLNFSYKRQLQNPKFLVVKVVSVYVGEQLVMVQNDYVVFCIYIFLPIKSCMMCFIPPWLLNFDQSAINEPNTPW